MAETEILPRLRTTAEHKVAEAASVVHRDRPKLKITETVAEGTPAQQLIEYSTTARMVVMGANSVGRAGTVLLGSTALRVANHASCPVAVWRGDVERPRPDSRPIMVGVDGHPGGEAAVDLAFELAALLRVDIIAVHAWYDPALLHWNVPADVWAVLADQEEVVLAERMAGWRGKYPDVCISRITHNGSPAEAMLTYAIRAQLMVTGSHGRNRVTGLLLDSVSQNLLHHAPCPTIICHDQH